MSYRPPIMEYSLTDVLQPPAPYLNDTFRRQVPYDRRPQSAFLQPHLSAPSENLGSASKLLQRLAQAAQAKQSYVETFKPSLPYAVPFQNSFAGVDDQDVVPRIGPRKRRSDSCYAELYDDLPEKIVRCSTVGDPQSPFTLCERMVRKHPCNPAIESYIPSECNQFSSCPRSHTPISYNPSALCHIQDLEEGGDVGSPNVVSQYGLGALNDFVEDKTKTLCKEAQLASFPSRLQKVTATHPFWLSGHSALPNFQPSFAYSVDDQYLRNQLLLKHQSGEFPAVASPDLPATRPSSGSSKAHDLPTTQDKATHTTAVDSCGSDNLNVGRNRNNSLHTDVSNESELKELDSMDLLQLWDDYGLTGGLPPSSPSPSCNIAWMDELQILDTATGTMAYLDAQRGCHDDKVDDAREHSMMRCLPGASIRPCSRIEQVSEGCFVERSNARDSSDPLTRDAFYGMTDYVLS